MSFHTCPICYEPYDDDPSAFKDKSISNLPVQSRDCRHMICYTCITGERNNRINEAEEKNSKNNWRRWMKCPICSTKTCFNLEEPNISYGICDMLREIRSISGSAPHAQPAVESESMSAASAASASASSSVSVESSVYQPSSVSMRKTRSKKSVSSVSTSPSPSSTRISVSTRSSSRQNNVSATSSVAPQPHEDQNNTNKAPILKIPIEPDDEWPEVWYKLKDAGYSHIVGTGLVVDYYILPFRNVKGGTQGEDYFTNQDDLKEYCCRCYGWDRATYEKGLSEYYKSNGNLPVKRPRKDISEEDQQDGLPASARNVSPSPSNGLEQTVPATRSSALSKEKMAYEQGLAEQKHDDGDGDNKEDILYLRPGSPRLTISGHKKYFEKILYTATVVGSTELIHSFCPSTASEFSQGIDSGHSIEDHEAFTRKRSSSSASNQQLTRKSSRTKEVTSPSQLLTSSASKSLPTASISRKTSKRKSSNDAVLNDKSKRTKTQASHSESVKNEGDSKVIVNTKNKRLYGDRFLIGRHETKGIMKLGGNCQDTFPEPRADHPRLSSPLGSLPVACFSDIWQSKFAPQFAGQDGCVDFLPDHFRENGAEFALFMRRSRTKFGPDAKTEGPLLGWEYCGNYTMSEDAEDILMEESALSFSPVSKRKIAENNLASARNNGYGRGRLDKWRAKLEEATQRDRCSPGPKWMVENRWPTDEERAEGQYPIAARARALGYRTGISDELLSQIMVNLDEYFTLIPITFKRYQKEVYEYVKEGKTNKDSTGKIIRNGETPARASDWYGFLDALSY